MTTSEQSGNKFLSAIEMIIDEVVVRLRSGAAINGKLSIHYDYDMQTVTLTHDENMVTHSFNEVYANRRSIEKLCKPLEGGDATTTETKS